MPVPPRPDRPPGTPDESRPTQPSSAAAAALDAVSRLARDLLLNGAVLASLVVGVGGVLTGRLPWLALGPAVGVVGIVASVAAMRERRTWSSACTWVVVVGVLVADAVVMTLMWT